MSVKLSLLAILDEGACYGNQLRAEFERRTAATWPVNVGQVYTTLERLERDGLVSRMPGNESGHVLYAITQEGRAQARAWIGAPVERTGASRDEFVVKLALAMTLPRANPRALIDAQRRATGKALTAVVAGSDGLTDRLFRESARLNGQAELAWLDYCEALLVDRVPFGLAQEPPRRGRPARAS